MNIATFVENLRRQGIELWTNGEQLSYRGNAQALTPAMLGTLKAHKVDLIQWLTTQSATAPAQQSVDFSLLFFASNQAEFTHNKYQLMLNATRFADQRGFKAVWLPERHFHAFGGLYPNPSVLAAALAMTTRQIRLRAGSVVIPLQNPIRVAEEWAVVDNLSGGRVDLAFAQGWNARDFVLAPSAYPQRLNLLWDGMEQVRRLWRGESIELPDGNGKPAAIQTFPLPQQPELAVWATCSGGTERFIEAGAKGVNVLTALLFQTPEELADKIAAYRKARADHGFEGPGHVTLMLHTLIGHDLAAVKATVKAPFIAYLNSSVDLWRQQMQGLDELAEEDREAVLEYAFERYFETAALFGTPDSCAAKVTQLRQLGVDEIACLLDFGVGADQVLEHLGPLDQLRTRFATSDTAPVTLSPTH
ncbi:MupA/Atu3671 family FMN-dependent luciferase-like monooxygenase [Chitinivorax sp. B]|uniref:MupA/Atu3671 family FMN-dependent luciferase-like monooxygenase n=1 Tax=Chitinivorax sp. B TaxID=2502235 RepID=UPI0020174029|nr:MupA/Atu3671 family FMN-dependent luciferase-like monooxygenase [Chitinivorax sp. B]